MYSFDETAVDQLSLIINIWPTNAAYLQVTNRAPCATFHAPGDRTSIPRLTAPPATRKVKAASVAGQQKPIQRAPRAKKAAKRKVYPVHDSVKVLDS